ncbi:hypothetical protein ACIQWA_00415 [Kitasatospora sp. NPDC098652]|uniref:hypothetical protein n=1 Tax=Kitasatospora sp. NPDC098652 TaxID=3364095 RepID=UPI0037F6084A
MQFLAQVLLNEPDDGTDEPVLFLEAVGAAAVAHEDGPDYDTAREAWTARTRRPPSAVLGRLGGSPAWLQGDETPSCPGCDRPMPLAVQLEEGPDRATAMNFGGGGRAFAFTCGPCARAVLLWQC